jgi:peptide/nickel transport system permease protein
LKLRYYIIRRVGISLLVFLGVIVVTFFISRIVPSNPAALYSGSHPTAQDIANARQLLHLDQPLYVQIYYYVINLFSGNFGNSLLTHTPVFNSIMGVLPNTLTLITVSIILAILLGVPIGVLSAVKQSSLFDKAARVFAALTASFPSFWLGLIFQMIFFSILHVLPLEGYLDPSIQYSTNLQTITGSYLIDTLITGNFVAFSNVLVHMILPALTLAAYPVGLVIRQIRASMISVLQENYIRTARAYGITSLRIDFIYSLKNAIIPTLVVVGLSFAYSLTGAFFVEEIFDLSGVGQYSALAILSADYPSIVGVTIIGTIFYIVINLATDLAQAFLDPRVALG